MEPLSDLPALEASTATDITALEAALQGQSFLDQDFEHSLRAALAAVGGALLFAMHIENEEEHEHIAAIALGAPGERKFFLVTVPTEGGELRVEPAESSDNPLAHITASYADLAEAYAVAA
jgi:hypothetical protein